MLNIQNVKSFVIFNENGIPIIKREYKPVDYSTVFSKIKNNRDEITIVGENLVMYKILENIYVVLITDLDVNEIMYMKCLDAYYAALLKVLKSSATVKTLTENYDYLVLLTDGFVFEGIVLEDDADKLVSLVEKRPFESLDGIKMTKGFASMFTKATKRFSK